MRSQRLVALLLLVPMFFIAGAGTGAWAYWKTGGTGSGTGTTRTVVALTLSPATPSAQLYPGASTSVVLTATNPNTVPVRIVSLALDTTQGTGGFTVDGAHSGCTPLSILSLATQSTGWNVPAKVGAVNGTLSITLTNALAMSAAAANACQGATFTVYLAAGP